MSNYVVPVGIEILSSAENPKTSQILSIDGIPEELNVHRENFGKDASEVDYDGIGPCPFCNSRIDEFNYCACGGNLGVS
jgi:hypothetical protein